MFRAAVCHYQSNQLLESELLFRIILTIEPRHADTLHLLGLIACRNGQHDTAIELIEEAIQVCGNNPSYYSNLGNVLKLQGRIQEAAAHQRHALALKPDYAEAHHNLAVVLSELGEYDDALRHYERVLALQPDFANAHSNMGVTLADQGRITDATARFERALASNPHHVEALNNLGKILYDRGDTSGAIALYERALAIKPDCADIHSNLGLALSSGGRLEEALSSYLRVLAISPGHADTHIRLGNLFCDQGKTDVAASHYERAIAINPAHAEAHNNLGNVLKDYGKFAEAMAHYDRAIAIKADYAEVHFNRSGIKTFRNGDTDLAALEALANKSELPETKKLYVNFALAKALEDSGDYVRAFEQMREGNALKRRQITYDEASVGRFFERIVSVFDKSLFDRFQGCGDPSSVPVFVLGMPRSGSTLIEQILASHPRIHGAGERTGLEMAARSVLNANGPTVQYPECIPDLDEASVRRIARLYLADLPEPPEGKTRITDKMPGNFASVGLIRMILPNARIIHTTRNPIDTCVSCFSNLFASGQPFTYDMAELGRYYRRYNELMNHWRSVVPPEAMLDVAYEDVVDDLEGQARRLIDHCGLSWDDRCLDFHRNSRSVRTASAVQIRKPLFRSSLERWRKYEAFLVPLLQELGELPAGGKRRLAAAA
jgi:tetratricopeptide (TPR) repeat protein